MCLRASGSRERSQDEFEIFRFKRTESNKLTTPTLLVAIYSEYSSLTFCTQKKFWKVKTRMKSFPSAWHISTKNSLIFTNLPWPVFTLLSACAKKKIKSFSLSHFPMLLPLLQVNCKHPFMVWSHIISKFIISLGVLYNFYFFFSPKTQITKLTKRNKLPNTPIDIIIKKYAPYI